MNNRNNKKQKYHELNSNDKYVLIPQNNKYINIYHNHPILTTPPLLPPQLDLFGKTTKDTPPAPAPAHVNKTRIILRKQPLSSAKADGVGGKQNNEDEFIGNLFNSLFSGISGNSTAGLDIFKSFDTKPAKKEPNESEIVIPSIDFEKMKFIDEKPKTLDDLIELIPLIDTKYNLEDLYNFDLKKLKGLSIPLQKLKKMVGLYEIKDKIIDIILYYAQRLDIKNCDMLHTIIDGPPGSGKTEIAHIYSEILASLGVLSRGTFRKAKKHDLIGGYLGHTAMKTSKLLEETKGGVLFIDEIYSLGNSDGKEGKDIYAKECVDLIMEFMSENKNDFVLVVAGYKDDIKRFFLSMNDGLERRFPIHLSVGEYTPEEMGAIFLKKVDELKWNITDDAIPDDFFKENKDYFKFYGGDMEMLLSKCKYAHSRNLVQNNQKKHRLLDKNDILDGFQIYIKNPEIEERKKSAKYLSFYL